MITHHIGDEEEIWATEQVEETEQLEPAEVKKRQKKTNSQDWQSPREMEQLSPAPALFNIEASCLTSRSLQWVGKLS